MDMNRKLPNNRELIKLRSRGFSYAEIGLKYGVTRQAVFEALQNNDKCKRAIAKRIKRIRENLLEIDSLLKRLDDS
jgi:predicted transcriptional regulator